MKEAGIKVVIIGGVAAGASCAVGLRRLDENAIDNAVNIPLGQLRDRIDEIPKDVPILIFCTVDIRA